MGVKQTDVMRVIINADDLGMDVKTNTMVFELMSSGKITSATIMANGKACEDAVRNQNNFSNCSFGIHLNLTSGKPLSGKTEIVPLLNDDGFFCELDSLIDTPFSPNLMKAVYAEFCMQVEKLQCLGLGISHIDSHQHIHNLPKIFPIVKLVQKKYNIRKIRLTKNLYLPEDGGGIFRSITKKIFNSCMKKMYKSYTTDYFTGFDTFYRIAQLRIMKGKSAELMVHLRDRKSGDYALLMHDWRSDLVFPVELVSYWQINGVR